LAGFAGTEKVSQTKGAQATIGPFSTFDFATLGTLSTNGRNMKLEVYATAVDNASDSSVISFKIITSYYRNSGSLASLSSHC